MDAREYCLFLLNNKEGKYRLMGDIIRIIRAAGSLDQGSLVNTINRIRMNRGEEPVLREEVNNCIDYLLGKGLLSITGSTGRDWSGKLVINGLIKLPEYIDKPEIFKNDNLMDEITLYL